MDKALSGDLMSGIVVTDGGGVDSTLSTDDVTLCFCGDVINCGDDTIGGGDVIIAGDDDTVVSCDVTVVSLGESVDVTMASFAFSFFFASSSSRRCCSMLPGTNRGSQRAE